MRRSAIRRHLRNGCVVGVLASAAMLAAEVHGVVVPSLVSSPTVAALDAGTAAEGTVVIAPTSGVLGPFSMTPEPAPAFCPGDSATGGYRWQTFIADASNDPATFTYNADGPVLASGGTGVAYTLFSTTGEGYVNRNTGADVGQGGQITPIPGFDFAVFEGALGDGDFNIGFACSLNGETVAYWSVGVEVAGGNYTVDASSTTTTTTTSTSTTTTTTVHGNSTSTTTSSSSSSSVPGTPRTGTVTPSTPRAGESYEITYAGCEANETITFSQPQSTPASVSAVCSAGAALSGDIVGLARPQQASEGSAVGRFTKAPASPGTYRVTAIGPVSGEQITTFVIAQATGSGSGSPGGSPSGAGLSSSGRVIAATGSSGASIVVWAIVMIVFGRMAILLGRKPRIVSSR